MQSLNPIIRVQAGNVKLSGDVSLPPEPSKAKGLVVFAQGSQSAVTRYMSQRLLQADLGVVFLELLTAAEIRQEQQHDNQIRFEIKLLSERLSQMIEHLEHEPMLQKLPVGLLGVGTGVAAALQVAAAYPERIRAIVSCEGRPDLADASSLRRVAAPTLLLLDRENQEALGLNQQASRWLRRCQLESMTVGTQKPAGLEQMTELAVSWLRQHLPDPRITSQL